MSLNMQPTKKSMVMTPEFANRLANSDGIVIASKIPPGKGPWRKGGKSDDEDGPRKGKMHCIICDSRCLDQRELRNHFVSCVDRNGNPTGARWIDGWEKKTTNRGSRSTRSSGSRDPQSRDSMPGDLIPLKVDPDPVSLQPQISPFQPKNLQPASTAPGDIPLYDHYLENIDPRLRHPSLNSTDSYDPYRRLDSLTNLTLLSFFQGWQDIIDNGGERYALQQPRFHALVAEFAERGIMSLDLIWTVDVKGLDMAFARKTGKGRET